MTTTETVDLRSDTLTKPTAGMRAAMAEAEVGDDVFAEDPTVNEVQQRCAKLFGKETALFVPSGTMGNLLAILSQTDRGETVILSDEAHPFNYEAGNLGMVAGVLTRTVMGGRGMMSSDDIAARIVKSEDHHFSQTTLIAIENTTNRGSGAIYPVEELGRIRDLATAQGLSVHCDGARIFNAVVESGVTPAEYGGYVDSLSFCFSKGLGAPVGSMLMGTAEMINRAHRFRKMLGGGMRQVGILAAAARYSLDNHIDRLKDDHARARKFRDALESNTDIHFPMPTPTNIVIFEVPDPQRFVDHAAAQGVHMLAISPTSVRAVFHLDVDDAGLERAIEVSLAAN